MQAPPQGGSARGRRRVCERRRAGQAALSELCVMALPSMARFEALCEAERHG